MCRARQPDKTLSATFSRTVAESGRYRDGNEFHLLARFPTTHRSPVQPCH